ncbi:Tfiih basal transcription factor complex p44 subunit, partial [Daphnia magna]
MGMLECHFHSLSLADILNRAVGHPTLRILRKCENVICVQSVVRCPQRLMGKPTISLLKYCFLLYNYVFP